MWPWSRRAALFASLLLLVVLVAVVVVSSTAADWPEDSLTPWVLLGAVIVALLPLLLTLIDLIAAGRGSLSIAKLLTIQFGADERVVAASASSITPNIVGAGVDVADSGNTRMRNALRSATHSDVVELDLGNGEDWWTTRLLVLVCGAARLGRPSALAFVARDGGRDRVFQGWATPESVVEGLLRRNPDLRFVYWYSQRSWAGQFALLDAHPHWASWTYTNGHPPLRHSAAAPPANPPPAVPAPTGESWRVPGDLGPEMLLAAELQQLEPPATGISIGDLNDVVGPSLHRTAVELTDPAEQQVDTVLGADDEFVAVLRNGSYTGLARVDEIARGLLRSTIALLSGAKE